MTKVKIEVKSHEYKVSDVMARGAGVLYTVNLDDDIAFSLFSPQLGKVGLARQINEIQLKQMLQEINPNNVLSPVLDMRAVGGQSGSEKANSYLHDLMGWLVKIDTSHAAIKCIGSDILDARHPNSIEIDCFRGQLNVLTCLGEAHDSTMEPAPSYMDA